MGVSTTPISSPSLQEQYQFIHDAVLECWMCGDTQIAATNLRKKMTKLRSKNLTTNSTGYEEQFKVQCVVLSKDFDFDDPLPSATFKFCTAT